MLQINRYSKGLKGLKKITYQSEMISWLYSTFFPQLRLQMKKDSINKINSTAIFNWIINALKLKFTAIQLYCFLHQFKFYKCFYAKNEIEHKIKKCPMKSNEYKFLAQPPWEQVGCLPLRQGTEQTAHFFVKTLFHAY